MPYAKLNIDIPEGMWIYDISTKYPEIVFEIVTAIVGEGIGVSLVRLHAEDTLPVIMDIDKRDDIDKFELLRKQETELLLQIQTPDPLLLRPVWQAGVPLTMPFDIQNGRVTWELTTSTDRLSRLRTQLEELDVGFSIEYVRDIDGGQVDQLLTDRQQEVLLTAIQEGYYRAPREATLGEVADVLGIANATCSDILHRAEGHIIHWFAEEHVLARSLDR